MPKTTVRKHRRRTKSGVSEVKRHSRRLDFPKGQSNEIHITITVPSTKIDKAVPQSVFNNRINETRRFLSRFGGYTSVDAIGGWVSSDKLIKEKVANVETFARRKDYLRDDLTVKRWLQQKKKDWKQEAIAFTFNGRMYFV